MLKNRFEFAKISQKCRQINSKISKYSHILQLFAKVNNAFSRKNFQQGSSLLK